MGATSNAALPHWHSATCRPRAALPSASSIHILRARIIGGIVASTKCLDNRLRSVRSKKPKNSEIGRDGNDRRNPPCECDAQHVLCRASHGTATGSAAPDL